MSKVCAVGLLLASVAAWSQTPSAEADLFLVSACPTSTRRVRASVELYRLARPDAYLEFERVVYDPPATWPIESETASFVVYDPKLRIMLVGTPALAPTHFDIIRMDGPEARDAFDLELKDQLLTNPPLLLSSGHGGPMALFNWGRPRPFSETLIAVNLQTKEHEKVSRRTIGDADITGGAQGYEHSNDAQYASQFDNGVLVLKLGGYAVEIPPPIPAALRFDPKELLGLYLKNDRILVAASLNVAPNNPNGLGTVTFRVCDRSSQTWKLLKVPGNSSMNVRAFGPWMAGMVTENDLLRRPGYADMDPTHPRISPGKEERGQDVRITGAPIDAYLVGFEYRPGILFLYHAPTGRYYQFDTHQGDSEILLVEGDELYYRVNRTIYRAAIGEKTIGKPTFVVDGDQVPDIHWIFFGPKPTGGKTR